MRLLRLFNSLCARVSTHPRLLFRKVDGLERGRAVSEPRLFRPCHSPPLPRRETLAEREEGMVLRGRHVSSLRFSQQTQSTTLQNQCSRSSSQCVNAQILRLPGSWPAPLSEINRARAPPLLDLVLFRPLITCRGIFFPGSGWGWSLFI